MTTRSLLRWLSLAFFASTFFVTTSVHAQGAASDDAPLTKRPVLSHFVMAPYPDGALAAKAEAVVVMEIDVDANGNVENVRSLGQQGGGDFDFVTPAVEAAKQFQFEPAEAGGATVPVTITYKYKFVLPKLGEISGVVLDRRTNQPIDAAHVIATVEVDGKWLKVEATTSANGRFDFKGLPPGSWKVQARAAGFQRKNQGADVESDSVSNVRLLLDPPPTSEYDVLVEAKEDDAVDHGRVFHDPSQVVPNTPVVSGVVVTDTGGTRNRAPNGRGGGRGGRGGFGGRGGGGPPGVGPPGGGRPPGGPPPGGPPPGGGGSRPPGAPPGGFGGAGTATTSTTTSLGSDVVTVVTDLGGIDLRGQNPANTAIKLDGIDVPLAYHFGVLRPVVPVGLLESTAFYPGSFPIEFGGATAGLVAMKSDASLAQRFTGYVDANWADTSGLVRVPLSKTLTISISGQYSTLDQIMSEVVPNHSDVGLAPLPRYRDAEVKVVYRVSPTTKIQLLGIASQDRMVDWYGNTALGDPPPGSVTEATTFYRAIFTAESKLDDDISTRLVVGGGTDVTTQRQPDFDVQTTKLQVRPSLRWKLADFLTADFGGEYLVDQLRGTLDQNAAPVPSTLSAGLSRLSQTTANEIGAYVGGDWAFSNEVHVFPGARLEHYWQTSETVIDPRVLARWDIAKDESFASRITLKAAVGEYTKPPSLLETSAQIGNTSLQSEDSIQYLGGVEYQFTKELMLDVDGFYVNEENMIVSSSAISVVDGRPRSQVFSNGGSGNTSGFEVFAQQQLWNHLEGWLYYTYSVSNISTDGGSTSFLSTYDQTHVLGVALSYELPLGWRARSRFQYASGAPTTSIIGSVFDSTTNSYVSIPGATLGDRTPAFSQLDLRIEKMWKLRPLTITAYVDVRNVYNRANVVTPYTYNYDYSQSYARSGLPILPMAGARIDF